MLENYNAKYDSDDMGLYVHVPFCRTKCRYCSFYSEPVAEHDTYAVIRAMIAEMERYKLAPHRVKTVYIGGGSPSSLDCNILLHLLSRIKQQCPAAAEVTIELNPGQVDEAMLLELRKVGVDRLSIGAQSFIEAELDFLGRRHTPDCTRQAVRQARAAGFENISLDLLFAVPGSCLRSWKHNLNAAVGLAVDHISAYSLTYEDKTPLGRALAAGMIKQVDEDTDRQMYEMTIDELAKAGMEQYEISNFANVGFQCRHNLNYWANGSYAGIGPAAASYLNGVRSTNFADINSYTRAVANGETTIETSETLNPLERACETAVLNLRRRCGIVLAQFEQQTGFDAMELFAEPIRTYQEQGLMVKENGRLALTPVALAIADSILCDFAIV